MKKFVPLAVIVVVVLLIPYVCYPAQRTAGFRVRVVDERTGVGIPDARVTVENGAEGTTAFDGSILFWLDTTMMNRTARFSIEQHGVTTSMAVPVTPGGLVALPVPAR